MKHYIFIVEKTDTGFSSYAKDENIHAVTVGASISEIKSNALEALNLLFEHQGKRTVSAKCIIIQLDIAQVFNYFEINAKAFSHRIGMNPQLLNQYINGTKEPSHKQVSKIAEGLKQFGKELVEIEYA